MVSCCRLTSVPVRVMAVIPCWPPRPRKPFQLPLTRETPSYPSPGENHCHSLVQVASLHVQCMYMYMYIIGIYSYMYVYHTMLHAGLHWQHCGRWSCRQPLVPGLSSSHPLSFRRWRKCSSHSGTYKKCICHCIFAYYVHVYLHLSIAVSAALVFISLSHPLSPISPFL